jgi:proline racemase
MRFSRVIQTIDSHTEGNPTRVIVGGVPVPPGASLLDKRAWLKENGDDLRRLLNFEPRGGGLMCSVLLLPAVDPAADFSVIIMEQDEYVPMCGHCIIGTATTVVAMGMVPVEEPVTTLRLEAPAGIITCAVAVTDGVVKSVTFENAESFLLLKDQRIETASLGPLSIDVAYGGDFYALVDADPLGIELTARNIERIVGTAREVRAAVAEQLTVSHPERPDIDRCYMVQFTSRHTTSGGDGRNAVIAPPDALDRSPCGTGTSARVAQLVTRGVLALHQPFKQEGPLGTYFTGEAVKATERDGRLYVVPRVTGRAFITGMGQHLLEPGDPFQSGFRVGTPGQLDD